MSECWTFLSLSLWTSNFLVSLHDGLGSGVWMPLASFVLTLRLDKHLEAMEALAAGVTKPHLAARRESSCPSFRLPISFGAKVQGDDVLLLYVVPDNSRSAVLVKGYLSSMRIFMWYSEGFARPSPGGESREATHTLHRW